MALRLKDFGAAHQNLGGIYYAMAYDLFWKKNQYEPSGEFYRKAVQHDPENVDAYYGLANYYIEAYLKP